MVELLAFLKDEDHKNDKETAIVFKQDGTPPTKMSRFNMLLMLGLLIGKYEYADQKLGFPEFSCGDK
jgi:hypothetical protein